MESKRTKVSCFLCIIEKSRKSLVTAFPTNPVSTLVHWNPWTVIKSELTTNILVENNKDYFAPRFGDRKSDVDDIDLMGNRIPFYGPH